MKNRAVFLDRDGTINVDKNYLFRIEDFEFLPGALEGLRLLQKAGFLLVVVTNQSGIARGRFTEEDFHRLNSWMLETLEAGGIHIAGVYYCPHLPDAAVGRYRRICRCRKPAPGLYEQAARDLDIDLLRSFAIGDRPRDCAICERGCRGFLIQAGTQAQTGPESQKEWNGASGQVRRVSSLLEAAEIIVREELNGPCPVSP